jgi:hypothetical protein
MAAVTQKISNLLGGVSQQPDPIKLPGQVREAENVFLDPTFGCRKRPATQFVKQLATDIASDAKWFTILRDSTERYAVAVSSVGGFNVRVWDLDTGIEKNVNIHSTAATYFSGATPSNVKHLTVGDYTFLNNNAKEVALNTTSKSPTTTNKEALVSIDQIAYNTSYSIDLNNISNTTPTTVYKAKKLQLLPDRYQVDDGGACTEVKGEDFLIDHPTNSAKKGLAFRITNKCTAFVSEKHLSRITINSATSSKGNLLGYYTVNETNTSGLFANTGVTEFTYFIHQEVGLTETDAKARFKYINNYSGSLYLGVTVLLVDQKGKATVDITETGAVAPNDHGVNFTLYARADEEYYSRYESNIILKNGGEGWRVNDTVEVEIKDRIFTVKVVEEASANIYASDGSATFVTPTNTESGALNMEQISTALTTSINAITNYSAEAIGRTIKITKTNGANFGISTRGGTANTALRAVKGVAADITELPDQCWDGFVLKVANTEDSTSDDYYVKFSTDNPGVAGSGSWVETLKPDTILGFDIGTLPQGLIRKPDGNFHLGPLDGSTLTTSSGNVDLKTWAVREVGDDDTNPIPTFNEKKINNMFFYSNRFGFLAEDAVIMSQAGDYFNFFQTSALTVADNDPIDVTASAEKPAMLKAALGQPQGLLLFAENAQFMLSSEEVAFSPATVKMNEIANYFYKSSIDPIPTGSSTIFLSETSTYTKALEMLPNSAQNRALVADITRIIPEYLSPNLIWGSSSPNNGMVLLGDGTTEVFAFKFFNQGNERQIAGWSKWIFGENISLCSFEDDLIWIIKKDSNRHILAKMELIDDPDQSPLNVGFSKFIPRLDNYVDQSEVTLSSGTNTELKKITLPDGMYLSGKKIVVVSTTGTTPGSYKTVNNATWNSSTSKWEFEVEQELVANNFIVGLQYTSKITLPTIFVTSENKEDRIFPPMVEHIYMDLYYAGSHKIQVSKDGYDDYIVNNEAAIVNEYSTNTIPIDELKTVSIPIFTRGSEVKTTVLGEDIFPFSITSYSWTGHYNNRGITSI